MCVILIFFSCSLYCEGRLWHWSGALPTPEERITAMCDLPRTNTDWTRGLIHPPYRQGAALGLMTAPPLST